MIASMSTLRGPNARVANNGLRDAQNVCALTKVSTVLTFTKRDLQFQKPSVRLYTVKLFFVYQLLIWRQKWVAGVRHGNSVVVRRVSPGRIIVALF